MVRVWRHVHAVWTLHCVSPEWGDPFRVHLEPLIPSVSPTIVVHVDFIPTHIDHFGLEPLVDCVLDIDPLSNFEVSAIEVEGTLSGMRLPWSFPSDFDCSVSQHVQGLEVLVHDLEAFSRRDVEAPCALLHNSPPLNPPIHAGVA